MMILKLPTCLLLFYFMLEITCEIPDCRDVSFYFSKVLNERLPQNSVRSPFSQSKAVGYLAGNPSSEMIETEAERAPQNFRVFSTDYRNGFHWKHHDGTVDVKQPNLIIDSPQFRFAAEGKPIYVGIFENKKLCKYLEMRCRLRGKEPHPPTIMLSKKFHWDFFRNFTIPENAVQAGTDLGSKKPFYIGLVAYQKETYVAKIIPGSPWLVIVTDKNMAPLHITAARAIHILTAENPKNVIWVYTHTPGYNQKEKRIYKCHQYDQYIVTTDLFVCGRKSQMMIYGEITSWF